MKIQNALVSNILDRPQRYFTHVTTVTLSWRVQNIVVIGRVYFTLECFEFSSNFEFDRNMLSGTGARPMHDNLGQPPCGQAPVPLSIFRSNSKFDENSKHCSVKYTRPSTTIFCTRHDSVTVVTCAKYRCDRSNIFETRAFWIFIEFRIRSKYA